MGHWGVELWRVGVHKNLLWTGLRRWSRTTGVRRMKSLENGRLSSAEQKLQPLLESHATLRLFTPWPTCCTNLQGRLLMATQSAYHIHELGQSSEAEQAQLLRVLFQLRWTAEKA